MLTIPSAFTRQTGEAHWHVLMRARAIENGCFVLAAAQGGTHENGRETFGHSLVVDPWGRIVAEGGTEPGVIMAEIDPAAVAAARARIPSLQHGRRFRDRQADGRANTTACGQGRVMIRYALVCDRKHEFEIWFNNSADYDKQSKRKLVACPVCDSTKVDKAIMAPAITNPRKRKSSPAPETAATPAPQPDNAPVAMLSPQETEFRAKLKELRDHLTKNADNVGKKFPEEARKMHYGDIEHRSIYGEASPEDAEKMLDEGIEFHPLPVLPEEKN